MARSGQGQRGVAATGVLAALAAACAAAPAMPDLDAVVPVFELDPHWQPRLPDDWILGQVRGLFIDSRQHLWVIHMPGSLTEDEELLAATDPPAAVCCVAAPPVLELDLEGNVLQAWGGPGEGYVWPTNEHGIFVDHEDHVWLGAQVQGHIMKFTRDGRHVMTIGDPHRQGGSNDTTTLGGPAALYVDPGTNEVFVADGYQNRRVIVFNARTGAYLRHWGAYGERPDDDYELPPRGVGEPPSHQFSAVHGLAVSNDGLVYVADRYNSRIQVFWKDGTFLVERVVAPGTLGSGAAFDIAFSHDPGQEFLYLMDGTNNRVWILRRETLEVLDSFGRAGRHPGQFIRGHMIVVDADGNIYTGEAGTGKRLQRFLFAGYRPL